MTPPGKVKWISPTLEKDLPIPYPRDTRLGIKLKGKRNKGVHVRYPFKRMEVGDSFFVPGNGRNTLKVCCYHATRKSGHQYAVRQWREPDGTEGLRCWRII